MMGFHVRQSSRNASRSVTQRSALSGLGRRGWRAQSTRTARAHLSTLLKLLTLNAYRFLVHKLYLSKVYQKTERLTISNAGQGVEHGTLAYCRWELKEIE